MKNFCALIGKYFGLLAVAFLVLGFMDPGLFRWVLGKVGSVSVLSLLLGVVMFGMGTTLSLKDFVLVFKRPKDVLLGAVAQFFIMPFLAYLLSRAFDLSPALTVGVVLVGTCPGGTSSNVITFMSKGDLALSVTMTSVSTVLSPILTPFITYLLIGEKIAFDPVGMFLSILQIVISLIIGGVIGASKAAILANVGVIFLVVILHNCLGYALGFAVARLVGLPWKKAVALSIEVGMQNSGLAVGLAKAHFAAMPTATVPGAVFSAWHNISGAVLAYLYLNVLNPRFDPDYEKEQTVLESAPAKA